MNNDSWIQPLEGRTLLAQTISVLPYFPLDAGRRWTYDQTDDGVSVTNTVIVKDRRAVNGRTAVEVSSSESDGDRDLSSYEIGSKSLLVGKVLLTDGDGKTTTTFQPALLFSPKTVRIGKTYSATGGVEMKFADGPTLRGTASVSVTVTGYKNVRTPAGTFRTLVARRVLAVKMSGEYAGRDVSVDGTETSTGYYAKGVGTVREQSANTLKFRAGDRSATERHTLVEVLRSYRTPTKATAGVFQQRVRIGA